MIYFRPQTYSSGLSTSSYIIQLSTITCYVWNRLYMLLQCLNVVTPLSILNISKSFRNAFNTNNRSRKLTKRQVICQSANYCPFTNLTIWKKGQISALENMFFIKFTCNIEVQLFSAWWKRKISMPANTLKRQRQVCFVRFLRNLNSILLWFLYSTTVSCRTALLSV